MGEVVVTTLGPVVGSRENGVRRWLGIPYAAAPFGANRLRRPKEHPGWTEVRDATRPGPTVPKAPYRVPFDALLPEPHIAGDECLNLNIWAPQQAAGLPVLFWIHGGAYVNGSGIVPHYDGSAFARDGVVCVTLNYRLGAEGFLYTGDEHSNNGLRDQIAALQWVRDNIAAFGGDPQQVTIAGESAGAISVACLMSSPRAAGLFHRAISQSGSGHIALQPGNAKQITELFAQRLQIEPTRQAFAALDLDRLTAEVAAVRIEMAANPDPRVWGEAAQHGMAMEPVIDGDVLPRLPIEALREGAGQGVPLLVGTNRHEFHFFAVPIGSMAAVTDELLKLALMGYGYDPEALDVLGAGTDQPGEMLTRLITEWYFWIPSIRLAEALGRRGTQAYLYEFAWRTPIFDGKVGAGHYLEVPFVFDTLGVETEALLGPKPPQPLADAMHGAWLRFVKTGEPGWAPYDERSRATMVFDEVSAAQQDPHARNRAAWDKAKIPR